MSTYVYILIVGATEWGYLKVKTFYTALLGVYLGALPPLDTHLQTAITFNQDCIAYSSNSNSQPSVNLI